MGLNLYHGNRMELLAERLAEVLAVPPEDPFARETIIVQSKGMERWLSLELARRHGICANYEFPFPTAFIYRVFRIIEPDLPEHTVFDPDVMTWRLMDLLPGCLDEPGFESLKSYLPEAGEHLKRLQLARRIAGVFDQYLLFRPAMIAEWEQGLGKSEELGRDAVWQAELWRRLTAGEKHPHRAELFRRFLKAMDGGRPVLEGIPWRLSLFGISALPELHLQVFHALSRFVEVDLFLLNPCREYWGGVMTERAAARLRDRARAKGVAPGDLHLTRDNPLLASMGTMGRDFFDLTLDFEHEDFEGFREPEGKSLLAAIQSDILNLSPGKNGSGPRVFDPNDHSIQVHSCHGPLREVEVLRDRLLDMFERNPDLEPSDVIVMAPDIEEYAPYITAVFETPETTEQTIPFSIADRSLRRESRIVEPFLAILDMVHSRFTATEVLDLLSHPDLRARFGMDEADLEPIRRWIEEVRIRWGVDGADRTRLGLPEFEQNTWRAGLDRLTLGYALTGRDDVLFGGILPFEGVEGSQAEALGRLIDFAETLFDTTADLRRPRPVTEWGAALTEAVDRFFMPDADSEREAQLLRDEAADLAKLAETAGFQGPLDVKAVRWLLGQRLETPDYRQGFLTGGITFCALLPMRSIPFKVICLMGMNGDAYPRQTKPVGFDLIARHPRPGDRSRRNDDRYLFLEALLSAREKLYISYVGQSIRDNTPLPPSVVVSELLDYVAYDLEEPKLAERLTVRHRLQAFSPAYFSGDAALFGYSRENLEAARLMRSERIKPGDFIPGPLQEPEEEWRTVDLETLCRFYAAPARFLLEQRLGLRLEPPAETRAETEPFAVDALERYILQNFLVKRALEGRDLEAIRPAIKAGGSLPPGTLGDCHYEDLSRASADFARRTAPLFAGPSVEPVVVDLELGGFRLTGRIGNLGPGGYIAYRYAVIKGKDLLRLWIHHLALNCSVPAGAPPVSRLAGLDDKRNPIAAAFDPVADAGEILLRLLELYFEGLSRPLPLFPTTSLEYADHTARRNKSPEEAMAAARKVWESTRFHRGESEDEYLRLVYPGETPLGDEFRRLSLDVFQPLLGRLQKEML